jgi:hypothetical protein
VVLQLYFGEKNTIENPLCRLKVHIHYQQNSLWNTESNAQRYKPAIISITQGKRRKVIVVSKCKVLCGVKKNFLYISD